MKRIGFAGLMLVALLFAAQVASAEGWPGCPWGYDHNPACVSGPDAAVDALAAKPAGLAAPVFALESEQGSPCGVLSRAVYEAGYVACVNVSQTASAAKPAGLAASAPATALEQDSPCGVLSMAIYEAGYVACVDANRGTSVVPKPGGLARPAPALTGNPNLTADWVDRQIRNGNHLAAPMSGSNQDSQ